MTRLARIAAILAAALAAIVLALVSARALPLPGLGYGPVARIALPPAQRYDLPPVAGADNPGDPVVVIDPGHGGFDPGARTPAIDEKALTLGLALALRDQLLADGGVRVALTRADDRFVSLDERVAAARRLGAALFLSIHADSAAHAGSQAGEVAGASIYTLADRASSAAAQRFAQRENAVDRRVNGQALSGQSDAVSAILVDLSQRRTQAQSARLAALIERESTGTLVFHPQPRRAAALEVLRAPDVPSVLFESGYITNQGDAARLASARGQSDFARVMARAIRLYLAGERVAARRRGDASAIASPAPGP